MDFEIDFPISLVSTTTLMLLTRRYNLWSSFFTARWESEEPLYSSLAFSEAKTFIAKMSFEVVQPEDAENAADCERHLGPQIANNNSFCSTKWDQLLCWPPTRINSTVAIPCNASKIFLEIVVSSRANVVKEAIPGEIFYYVFSEKLSWCSS